jgi:hypothetical protein
MHPMKTQGFGKFVRFDPAAVAEWLERFTVGARR